MRIPLLPLWAPLLCGLMLTIEPARAQSSTSLLDSSAPGEAGPMAPRMAETPVTATRFLTGHVTSPAGVLPGAVVGVAGSRVRTVTNADGEFSLAVPAVDVPVQLTASYAGFADETLLVAPADASVTVELLTPKVVKVARKQQLKVYLKTARKQVRRSLRHK